VVAELTRQGDPLDRGGDREGSGGGRITSSQALKQGPEALASGELGILMIVLGFRLKGMKNAGARRLAYGR